MSNVKSLNSSGVFSAKVMSLAKDLRSPVLVAAMSSKTLEFSLLSAAMEGGYVILTVVRGLKWPLLVDKLQA